MGIILNLDCTVFYQTRRNMAGLVNEEYVRRYIDQYKETSVTQIMFNIGEITSVVPSATGMTYMDVARRIKETERETGKKFSFGCAPVLDKLIEQNIDVYEIWIDQCRKNNISPWISFRMNDCHFDMKDVSPLVPKDISDHYHDYSIVRHHRQIGWYDRCRDYEIADVRKRHLDYIEEHLLHYLPDGIELDFQRELNCFRPGHEWSGMEIMTDFMREVKKIVSRAEDKAGRKIKISIRCNQNPQYCMEWGFDIIEMARLGFIDAFAPCPRWNCTDTDIPVKLWKQILAPYNIPVYPGIDAQNIHPYPDDFMKKGYTVCPTVEVTLGTAVNFLAQGADGIYLFNYFNELPDEMITDEKRVITDGNNIFRADGYYKILLFAGNYEEAIKQKRRYMITYNDKTPLYRNCDAVLPLTVGGEYNQGFHSNGECNPRYLRFATGTISADKSCMVRFRIDTEGFDVNDVELYINCKKAEFIGMQEQGEPYYGRSPVYGKEGEGETPEVYAFRIPTDAIEPQIQVAEILLKEGKEGNRFVIDYADFIVE